MPEYRQPWEDPWRYTCPDCGSHSVLALVRPRVRHGNDKAYGWGQKAIREAEASRYKCDACGTRHKRVHDKKTGGTADPAPSKPC